MVEIGEHQSLFICNALLHSSEETLRETPATRNSMPLRGTGKVDTAYYISMCTDYRLGTGVHCEDMLADEREVPGSDPRIFWCLAAQNTSTSCFVFTVRLSTRFVAQLCASRPRLRPQAVSAFYMASIL